MFYEEPFRWVHVYEIQAYANIIGRGAIGQGSNFASRVYYGMYGDPGICRNSTETAVCIKNINIAFSVTSFTHSFAGCLVTIL